MLCPLLLFWLSRVRRTFRLDTVVVLIFGVFFSFFTSESQCTRLSRSSEGERGVVCVVLRPLDSARTTRTSPRRQKFEVLHVAAVTVINSSQNYGFTCSRAVVTYICLQPVLFQTTAEAFSVDNARVKRLSFMSSSVADPLTPLPWW